MTSWLRIFVLAAVGFTMLGCAKQRECAALIGLVDDDDEAIKAIDLSSKDPRKIATSTKKLATIESKLAVDLTASTFEVKEVKQLAADYAAFARETAAASTELASVFEKAAELQDRVDESKADSVTKRWAASVQKVVARCQAHPSAACPRFAQIIKDLPSNSDDMNAYGKALDKAAGDLKKLSTSDATLNADLDAVQKSTVEMAKVFVDTADLQKKQKANAVAMDAAIAKEKPLTERVNAFCGGTAAK